LRHQLLNMMDGRSVFSGGIPGRKLQTALNAATPPVDVPTATFLDFKGVAVATSSFLREAVIGFRDYARLSLVNVHPVAANLVAFPGGAWRHVHFPCEEQKGTD
jgi:hypothetical protein